MCQDDNLQDSDDEQSESLELSRNINGDSLEELSYLDSSETSEEKSNSRSGKKMLKDILVEQETKKSFTITLQHQRYYAELSQAPSRNVAIKTQGW